MKNEQVISLNVELAKNNAQGEPMAGVNPIDKFHGAHNVSKSCKFISTIFRTFSTNFDFVT